jgi:CRISPR-associated protein Csb1
MDYNGRFGLQAIRNWTRKEGKRFMDVSTLSKMVSNSAALRRRQRLQPVGGKGDKIFPPTYPGEGRNSAPRHIFERRQINGREAWCVLVDSVQSQANRLEESLLGLIAEGRVTIPHVVVDFDGCDLAGISKITSLDAPHRVYDAIFRDSLLDGKGFLDATPLGKRLIEASNTDASALLETSPTALLFGCWNSTGQGGGLGAKFARCLVSEIVAVDVPVDEVVDRRTGEVETQTAGRRTGSRIDPLGVLRKVEVFKGPNGWDLTETKAGKNAKKVRPSEINHGNIAPTIQPLGITCDYLEHTFVLSFAAVRRLHFGSPEKDAAGRTLLAALGLLALTEQDARGYALRSRCDLVCDGKAPLERIQSDGTGATLDAFDPRGLYMQAFEAAERAGIEIRKSPIELKPQEKLIGIVRKSQELALQGQGGDDSEADTTS